MPVRSILLGVLLAIPATARASQEAHFIQSANYCSPPATYLQGQLSFFNPSSESVTVEVTTNLLYAVTGGNQWKDIGSWTFTVAPGQSTVYQLSSTQAGYGCNGIMRFFGTIRATSNWGYVVASGNLMTTLIPISGGTHASNVPFAVQIGR